MAEIKYHLRGRDVNQKAILAVKTSLGSGKTVYIVGKGPSLDQLTADDFSEFPNAPVLCVNESVHAIEKLKISPKRMFCVQYDKLDGISNKPLYAKWLLSTFADKAQNGTKNGAIIYDLNKIAPNKPNLTAATAISISALAGANQVVMLGFDAAFSGNCDYANCIGHGPEKEKQKPERFVLFAKSGIPKRAAEEGMKLIWQSPKDFWYVALVLRSGGNYSTKHVEAIKEQIDRNLKNPHGIVLFTEMPNEKVWRTIPLSTDWPGWFSKLEMFRPDIGYRGGVLFTDLDNYFGREFTLPNWDKMVRNCLYMPRDPYRDMWISCLIGWRFGTVELPFNVFKERPVLKDPGNHIHSDQEVINETMKGRIKTIDFMSNASFKKESPEKDGVDCVFFHGTPKPWDIGWVNID